MDKQHLLHEVEQRHKTLELGIWDNQSKTRHSLLGNVGEALNRAAELAAEAESVIEDDLDKWLDEALTLFNEASDLLDQTRPDLWNNENQS